MKKKFKEYQTKIHPNSVNPHTSGNFLIRFLISNFYSKIYSFVKPLNIKTALDVGCGEGHIIHFLREKGSKLKFTGIDIVSKNLVIARKLNPSVKFEYADFFRRKFRQNSYDLVLCTEVLEHLKNPDLAVKKLKPIAKYFIISVPNEPFWRIANILRGAHWKTLGNTPHHLQNWTKNQFKKFLEKHFSQVQVKTSAVWTVAFCKK